MKSLGYWLVSLVLILGFLLSACAGPKAPAPEKPATAAPAAPKVELTREQQLIEGAKKEKEVVLWTNSFMDEGDRIRNAFKERYPFLELKNWDAPTGPSILTKLTEEARIGKHSADVVILVGGDALVLLDAGVLAEYDWPNTKGWPYQPSNNFVRALAGTTFLPVYNSNLVSAAEAPKSLESLADPKWKGRSVMTVSARDTPLAFAYYWRGKESLNWQKSFDFWTDVVKKAQPKVTSGITGPMELIAAGETPVFLWATTASFRLMWKGAPLALAKLEFAPTIPYLVTLVKDAPHPNAAKLFLDFLTSTEGSVLYADQNARTAYNPEAAKRGRANLTLAQFGINWVGLPIELLTEENYRKSQEFWYSVLQR